MTDEEKVTMTRAELDEWYVQRQKTDNMTPGEKQLRSVIREEVAAVIGELVEPAPADDAGERKPKNAPKNNGEDEPGIFDRLVASLTGDGAE